MDEICPAGSIDASTLINATQRVTISELISKLEKLKKEYGSRSLLVFDAGYNNVSVDLVPSIKSKRSDRKGWTR